MSIDQRRAKRKTTTLPGVLPGETGTTRLTSEGGTETVGNTIDDDDDD
jgi:hypothetical protein